MSEIEFGIDRGAPGAARPYPPHDHWESPVSTTAYYPGRISDFERAPWLPADRLADERNFLAVFVARDVARGRVDEFVVEDARAVALMHAEDMRLGDAYRAGYRAWKAAQA